MKGMIVAGIVLIAASGVFEALGFLELRGTFEDIASIGLSPMVAARRIGLAQACWFVTRLLFPTGLALLVMGLCLQRRGTDRRPRPVDLLPHRE